MTALSHVMLDLETLGTGDGAAIVQIGAVRFDPWAGDGLVSAPAAAFCESIRLDSVGLGTIDGPTVAWWLGQEREAQDSVLLNENRTTMVAALDRFDHWIREESVEFVWADSPNFDLRLLRQAFGRQGMPWPFTHRQERCHRTLKWQGRELLGLKEPERTGTKHHALVDAYHQAQVAVRILREMKS